MTRGIKQHLLAALIMLLSPFTLMAQNKQFTLEDLIPGGSNAAKFVPASLRGLQWSGDTYIYTDKNAVMGAVPGKKEAVIFDRGKLNEALQQGGLETVEALPPFSLPDRNATVISFTSKQHRIHYDYKAGKVVADYKLDSKWGGYDYSPGSGNMAFTEDNNLRILTPENKVLTVTSETNKKIVSGQSVHQNEFDISKGTYWSPSGNLLAFYRMDESMVGVYPLINIDGRMAKADEHVYPMAGMPSHHVTVGVYNTATGQTVWLKTGLPKEKYLTNIAWSPDEKSIYIAELNRDQNVVDLVRYTAATGEKEATLFTEKADKYVEPLNPIRFVPGKPDQFIWQSDRDGWNHLYLYNTSGQLIKQLTSGKWVVKQMLGFDAKGENLFITATAPHPASSVSEGTSMETYAWQVNLKSGKRTCFTPKKGVHSVSVSPSGKYAIDTYSTPTTPRDISVVQVKDGKELAQLSSAGNPYEGYAMPEITTGTIKAADGVTPLHYRLLKPVGLDESKKYPTVIYVYGGPHSQQVTGGFQYGTRGWEIYMAQKGYVVFVVDNRGTSNRGRDFEQVIHRCLGKNEVADQMKGVDFLKSLPYVDHNRIGVHGWSYGGFMTTNMMLTHPDVFKVGVAGGPVIDWSLYEIMYGERYMDHPDDNPEGYKENNLTLRADKLKGKLLIIHGLIDPVVVPQHSLSFLKACVGARTYPDFFVYPGHKHNVMGKDRIHLHEKITRYFDDNL